MHKPWLRSFIVVFALSSFAVLARPARAEVTETHSTVQGNVDEADPDSLHGYIGASIATDYRDTGLLLPLQVTAEYDPLNLIYFNGRANLGLMTANGIRPSEAGGDATLCLFGDRIGGNVVTYESLTSTRTLRIPNAARGCGGFAAGAMLQRYGVKVQGVTDQPFIEATAPIFYGGFHVHNRVKAAVRSGGQNTVQRSFLSLYFDAMYAPSVDATAPAGAPVPTFKKWGGRIGFERTRGSGVFGLLWGGEVGLLPGGSENLRIFLQLHLGVAFAG